MAEEMIFGTEERVTTLPCPDSAVDVSMSGWSTQATLLGGGAFIRRSANAARGYSFTWSGISHRDASELEQFYMGAHGQAPFYMYLPGSLDNVLPHSWSTPRLAALDAPTLVRGEKPRVIAAVDSNGYPTGSAHYITSSDHEYRTQSVVVPEGYDLHLGVHGSYSGSGGFGWASNEDAFRLRPDMVDDRWASSTDRWIGSRMSLQDGGPLAISDTSIAATVTATDGNAYVLGGGAESGTNMYGTGISGVEPGHKYQASLLVQAPQSRQISIYIYYYDATGAIITPTERGGAYTSDGLPHRMTHTLTAPAGSVFARVGFEVTGEFELGEVYHFTNAQLREHRQDITDIPTMNRTPGATNTVLTGPQTIYLGIIPRDGSVTLNAVIAALRKRHGGKLPPYQGFVAGQGHSGLEFVPDTFSKAVNSAALDKYTVTFEMMETGQWV